MILLSVDEICNIHKELMIATSGLWQIRDKGLLESAIYSIHSSYGNIEQYPSLLEKVARLTYALVKNHCFIDGNKRIGVLAMVITLDLNGVKLHYSQSELVELGLRIADGKYEYDDIYQWIITHKGTI